MEEGATDGSKSPQTDVKVTSRWHSGGKTVLAFHETRSLFSERGQLYGEVIDELMKGKKKKKPKGGF
jgi:hypothetical protein